MKSINEYNSAVLHLCEEFANKYFEQSDRNIIGNNNIGLGPLDVADRYFSIDDIVCALNNDITKNVQCKGNQSRGANPCCGLPVDNYLLLYISLGKQKRI